MARLNRPGVPGDSVRWERWGHARENGLYKTELIKGRGPWRTVDQAEVATAECVDCFNHRRLYEYCGDPPPAEMDAAHYARQPEQATADSSIQ